MRRLRLLRVVPLLLALGGADARGATPVWITPDVPTDETVSGAQPLPWQIFRYDGPVPSYSVELSIPGNPALDAIERMDALKNWLFSVESPSDLAGSLATFAQPRDVIRFDGPSGTYSFFFCGSGAGVPLTSNVDAVHLVGGDDGALALSLDVPTTIAGTTYDPADLLLFRRVGPACGNWVLVSLLFDASAAGIGIPTRSNLIGSDTCANTLVLSFDVPTDVGPPGVVTYLPGQLVAWDGVGFALYEPLAGWPLSSEVDGVATGGNPGQVPAALKVNKSGVPGNLVLVWTPSCSQGATDYGIYEGVLGTWYSHTQIDCDDASFDFSEEVTPGAGNRYYLAVPHNGCAEGSYGQKTGGAERPVGTAVCAGPQILTACP